MLDELESTWQAILILGQHPLESEIPLFSYALQLLFSYPSHHNREKVLGSSVSIERLNACTRAHVNCLVKLCSSVLLSNLGPNCSFKEQQILKQFLIWMSKVIDQTIVTVSKT